MATALLKRFDLQGHRGARGLWPENSLAGFAAAIALGVTSIELDVVLTADNVPVVFHDLALNPDIVRNESGAWISPPGALLSTLRADELQRYDIGRIRPRSRYAAKCRGQTPIDTTAMPTLAEACALIGNTPVVLDLEIKTARRPEDTTAGLARIVQAVLQTVQTHAAPGQARLRAFDWRVLRMIRDINPAIELAWLTGAGTARTPALVAAEIAALGWPDWRPVWAPDHRLLRKRHIHTAHALGLGVKPYTVNAAFRMRQLIRWGVDGFCTDRPDLGVRVRHESVLF